jgi:hypothetical protein
MSYAVKQKTISTEPSAKRKASAEVAIPERPKPRAQVGATVTRKVSIPPTIQYANLLKQHGHPDAPEVRAFLDQHSCDRMLAARARVLNRVFVLDVLSKPTKSPRNRAKV